jgi:hypothetical protein
VDVIDGDIDGVIEGDIEDVIDGDIEAVASTSRRYSTFILLEHCDNLYDVHFGVTVHS